CAAVRRPAWWLAPRTHPLSLLHRKAGLPDSKRRACWDEDLGDGDGVISWRSHVLTWAPWFRAGRPCLGLGADRTPSLCDSVREWRTASNGGRGREGRTPTARVF